jgi:hypothetical protein
MSQSTTRRSRLGCSTTLRCDQARHQPWRSTAERPSSRLLWWSTPVVAASARSPHAQRNCCPTDTSLGAPILRAGVAVCTSASLARPECTEPSRSDVCCASGASIRNRHSARPWPCHGTTCMATRTGKRSRARSAHSTRSRVRRTSVICARPSLRADQRIRQRWNVAVERASVISTPRLPLDLRHHRPVLERVHSWPRPRTTRPRSQRRAAATTPSLSSLHRAPRRTRLPQRHAPLDDQTSTTTRSSSSSTRTHPLVAAHLKPAPPHSPMETSGEPATRTAHGADESCR